MKALYLRRRFISLIVLICIIFVVFISQLVNWQIINTGYYKIRALHSHSYVLKTNPIRGEILDCNGVGLAANSVGYKLVLDDFNLPKGKEAENISKMLDLLDYLRIDFNDSFPIILENGKFIFDESKQSEIENLKKQFPAKNTSDPNSYIECIKSKINCENFQNSKNLRNMCSIYYSTRVNPVVADNIDAKAMCIISEFCIPGFRVEIFSKRYYPFSDLASHLLGYTALMSAEEYEKYKEKNYPMDAYIGKTGIEKLFEHVLHGLGGQKAFHFSREGTVTGVEDVVESKPGNSVMLTIDSNVQKAAQESLEKNIQAASSRGAKGCVSGAAVAINVKNGEIIASASYPSFDLERYSADKSYYNELCNDKRLPLLNRALSSTYPPGSTFKTLISLASLQEGVLNGLDETINCSGSYNYYSGYRLRCTGHHGSSNLLRALAKSCNVFFAELGRRLGLANIVKYANELGVSGKTGIELPEADGTLGILEKYSQYKSEASQSAIGQGAVSITPLQLAKIVSGIASGKNYKVHLVKKIINYTNSEDIEVFPTEYEDINVSEESLDMTRKAMREVVLTGLATDFKNYPVAVAAKTGTAQNAGDDHTTFVCYAPFDDPQIAVSVILANGRYGNLSKAVARDIMNAYFKF